MKIGILSDTHGNLGQTRSAAGILKAENVETLIHCGDIGKEDVLYLLAEIFDLSRTPLTAVWGNVDRWDPQWYLFPELQGLTLKEHLAELRIGQELAAVIHGDDAPRLSDTIHSGKYRWVFTGHTHVAADRTQNTTRIINPGAIVHTPVPSIATLDTELNFLAWHPLPSA